MSTKALVFLVLVPTIVFGLLISADYAVVDVHEGGPDGVHLIVPVPLALARVALRFAPQEAKYIEVPELAQYLPYAERIVSGLRDAEDGVLVTVDERDQHVRIEKVGNVLAVHVEDGEETVDAAVPLAAALDLLRAYDGKGFDTRDLLRAVGRAEGDLVHVRGRNKEEVKVWIW